MKKVICKQCGSEDILITEQLNPNDDASIRHYFTDAYDNDEGLCFCNGCCEKQEFQVIDTDEEKPDPWRCEECGSLDVQQQGWIDIHTGKVVNYNSCDRGDYWCEHCEEHNYPVRESYLMEETVEDWFANHLRPDDDEVISGLERDDYVSDEEYAAACKEMWDDKTNQEKIDIWHELTRDKSNDSE
jgi:hypothetical protein